MSGSLFIVAAASGTGKTSLVKALVESMPNLGVSVSHTTRPIRPGEVDGTNYHFTDRETFVRMIGEGSFLEHAEVFGNLYGTSKDWVVEQLQQDRDVILEIDWQGAQQLYQIAGGDVVRVFILPPSLEELERRLRGRATDSDEVITARMARAAGEIAHWDGYDYVLCNDDAEACFLKVKTILDAERMKRSRQTGLIGFIRKLGRQVPGAD